MEQGLTGVHRCAFPAGDAGDYRLSVLPSLDKAKRGPIQSHCTLILPVARRADVSGAKGIATLLELRRTQADLAGVEVVV